MKKRKSKTEDLEVLARLGLLESPMQTVAGLIGLVGGLNQLDVPAQQKAEADRQFGLSERKLALDSQQFASSQAQAKELAMVGDSDQRAYQQAILANQAAELKMRGDQNVTENSYKDKLYQDELSKKEMVEALQMTQVLSQAVNASKSGDYNQPDPSLHSALIGTLSHPGFAKLLHHLAPTNPTSAPSASPENDAMMRQRQSMFGNPQL